MWIHVPDAALMDVLDGAAGDRVRQHVAACEACRARVEDARAALDWTAQATVPDPIPSYWDVFRRRVAHALVEVPAERSRRPLWAAAAVAGAAMIAVLTLRPAPGPVAPHPTTVAPMPAWSALPPADEDPALPILEQVAPTVVAASPAVECADVSECVVSLTDEESGELADALRAQLARGRTL
jgi:hypothetical protein